MNIIQKAVAWPAGWWHRLRRRRPTPGQEAMLRSVLDTIPQYVFWKDRDGVYTGCNRAFARIVGHGHPDEVVGKTDLDIFGRQAGAEADRAEDAQVMKTGTAKAHIQAQVECPDGTRIWVDTTKLPLLDEAGEIQGVLGVFEDITERKRAAEALVQLGTTLRSQIEFNQLLLDTSPAFIVAIGLDGQTLMMNRALLEAVEYTAEEIKGTNYLTTFVPEEDRAGLPEVFRQIVDDSKPTVNENRIRSKSGQTFLVEWHGRRVVHEHNGLNFFVGVGANITKRRQAEIALRQSEEKYRGIFNATSDALVIHDLTGNILDVNQRMCELFGYPRAAALGLSLQDLSSGEAPYSIGEAVAKVGRAAAEGPQVFEWQGRRRNGECFWCEVALRADEIAGEKRVIAAVRDITERKQAAEALQRHAVLLEAETAERKEAETRLAAIINSTDDMIWSVDAATYRVTMFNEAHRASIEKRYGFAIQPGMDILERISPERARKWRGFFQLASQQGEYQTEYALPDIGKHYEAALHAIRREGAVVEISVFAKDVTERRRAEWLLRENEERLRITTETAQIGVWDWEVKQDTWYGSPIFYTMLGYAPQTGFDDRAVWLSRVHPEDRAAVTEKIQIFLNQPSASYQYEARMRHADGSYRWHRVIGSAVERGEDGKATRLIGVRIDITEQKEAEAAIRRHAAMLEAETEERREAERRLASIINSTDDMIWSVEATTLRMVEFNEALHRTMKQQYGIELQPGMTPEDILPAERAKAWRDYFRETIDHGELQIPYVLAELGKYLELTFHAIRRDGVVTGVSVFAKDVTDRRQAEAERQEAQQREQRARIEYTLQLIAAQEAERKRIAAELHDSLGQNLLLIKNRTQLALSRGRHPAETSEQLESVSQLAAACIAEARQIAHDLHPPQLDHLGLTRALEAMIERTAQTCQAAFTAKLEPVDDLFTAEAALNLYRIVQESLNNILKHAQARRVNLRLERDIHEVQLLIEDDGSGFPSPPPGPHKPGLGLRNMAERARILGGNLKVNSAPGQGTRIEVTIPVAEKADP